MTDENLDPLQLLDKLKRPQGRNELALGSFHEQLGTGMSQEALQDVDVAKKMEKQLFDDIRRDIEWQEVENTFVGDTVDQAVLKQYYEKLQQLRLESQEKVRKELAKAEQHEIELLNSMQRRLMKAEATRLVQNRQQLQQAQKTSEEEEQRILEERDKWRSAIHDDTLLDAVKEQLSSLATSPQEQQAQPAKSQSPQKTPRKDQQSSTSRQKLVLIMTVDIGDGRVDTIRVFEGNSYHRLALEFQAKHALPEHIVEPLADHIKSNIEALKSSSPKSPSPTSRASTDQRPAKKIPAQRPKSAAHDDSSRHSRSISSQQSQFFRGEPGTSASLIFSAKQRRGAGSNGPQGFGTDDEATPRYLSEYERARKEMFTGHPQIDSNSKRIVEQAGRNIKPVHLRLFEFAEAKQKRIEDERQRLEEKKRQEIEQGKLPMTYHSYIMSQGRNKGEHENYGVKLFHEGMRSLAEKERKAQLRKQLDDAKPEVEFPFKPTISNSARNLKFSQAEFCSRQIENQQRSIEEKQKLAEQVEQEQKKLFTFHPKLSKNTEKLTKEKGTQRKMANTELCELLHQEAEERRKRRKDYQEHVPAEATFRPRISRSSRALAAEKQNYADRNAFLDRLVNSRKETEKEIMRIRARVDTSIDPETGQPWFEPRLITPGPELSERRDGSNIFDSLFNISKLSQLPKMDEEDYLQVRTSCIDKSRKLAEESREKKLAALFQNMDRDNDGYLQLDDADTSWLDEILAGYVRTVLHKFEDQQRTSVSQLEFVEAMMQELSRQGYRGPPISELLNAALKKVNSKNVVDHPECTFKPKITHVASTLAKHSFLTRLPPDQQSVLNGNAQQGPSTLEVLEQLQQEDANAGQVASSIANTTIARQPAQKTSVFELLHSHHRVIDQHIKNMAKEKEDAILRECTFWPNTNVQIAQQVLQQQGGTRQPITPNESILTSTSTSSVLPNKVSLKLSPRTLDRISERLSTKKLLTNNELRTSEVKEIQDCTFSPRTNTKRHQQRPMSAQPMSPNTSRLTTAHVASGAKYAEIIKRAKDAITTTAIV